MARLARGEKISLRSVIKAETLHGEMETVHATIAGDPSSTQDVIISGHWYEGYLKQGANDDNSGCALTLEVGRAYIKLVAEGKLPKPKHTIHFLWVPEISGTNAWLNAHPDIARRVVADLNFDMEGIRLSTSRSYWILQRTPASARTATRRASPSSRPTGAMMRSTSGSTSTTARAITSPALSYIADAADAGSLAGADKDAIVTIKHQADVEKGVVRSARALFDNPADGEKKVQVFEPLIDKRAAVLLDCTAAASRAATLRQAQGERAGLVVAVAAAGEALRQAQGRRAAPVCRST